MSDHCPQCEHLPNQMAKFSNRLSADLNWTLFKLFFFIAHGSDSGPVIVTKSDLVISTNL